MVEAPQTAPLVQGVQGEVVGDVELEGAAVAQLVYSFLGQLGWGVLVVAGWGLKQSKGEQVNMAHGILHHIIVASSSTELMRCQDQCRGIMHLSHAAVTEKLEYVVSYARHGYRRQVAYAYTTGVDKLTQI